MTKMPTLNEILHVTLAREALMAIMTFMVSIIVVLFVVLVVHKLYVEYREQRYRSLKQLYGGQLRSLLSGGDVRIEKPVCSCDYEAWADVIAETMVNSSGERMERLKDMARQLKLDAYYREMAHARQWTGRFIAVEKLGMLRLHEMKELYFPMLQQENVPQIVSKAVWALSMVADDDAVAMINQVLKNPAFMSSKFAEFIYTNIIIAYRDAGRDEGFLRLLGAAKNDADIPTTLKRDIVSACGSARFSPACELIRDYFHGFPDSAEMRIACIRALERLSDSGAGRIISAGLEDPDWRVRAVAAGSARNCGGSVVDQLCAALRDRFYHVRMNAAMTLTKLGPSGIKALTETTRADDRFAGDAARYALKR
jgi:hypothetical protein